MSSAPTVAPSFTETLRAAKVASVRLAALTTAQKDAALHAVAAALVAEGPRIVAANELDLARAADDGVAESLRDRLRLDAVSPFSVPPGHHLSFVDAAAPPLCSDSASTQPASTPPPPPWALPDVQVAPGVPFFHIILLSNSIFVYL